MTPPPNSGRPPSPPDDIEWDVVAPAPTSAFDRIQTRTVAAARASRRRLPPRSRTAWLVAGIAALVVVAAVATWWVRRADPGSDRDLLVGFSATAEDFEPTYRTADPEQAEAYVADVFGWPIGLPDVPGLRLVGVGEAALSSQLSVPAFRFEGASGDDAVAVVFAYDYVFLGQAEGTLDLPEATYAQLAEPEPVDTRRLGGAYLVTWRQRAVVYTAVTDSEDAFERIGQRARETTGGAAAPGRAPQEEADSTSSPGEAE